MAQDDASFAVDELHLRPSAFKDSAGLAKWQAGGRSVGVAAGPVGGEVATWTAPGPSRSANESTTVTPPFMGSDRAIYFTTSNLIPPPIINFYTETYTLFSTLQNIIAMSIRLPNRETGVDAVGRGVAEVWDRQGNLVGVDGLLGPPDAEAVGHMRRIVKMYIEEIQKLREPGILDVSSAKALLRQDEQSGRYDAVLHTFQLAEILYLPQDGRGEGLLGEELLDWVNATSELDTKKGNEIMSQPQPWKHSDFWSYVFQCILRGYHLPAASCLRTLQRHRHTPIAQLGPLLASHLQLLPRSHNTTLYPLDHQFLSAHRSWLAKLRAELAAFLGGRGVGRWLDDGRSEEDWSEWEAEFKAVVELMEGNADTVMSESEDWKEAIGAYGTLCNVALKRDDLPGLMKRILKLKPIDSTQLDDVIQSNLCSGNIIKALMGCYELDVWLAAHLGDVFDKLALIPDDEERFEISLRDYFLLEYTDILQSNPRHDVFWRMTADYLSAAGEEGRARLRAFIMHSGLGLQRRAKGKQREVQNGDAAEMNGSENGDEGAEQFRHFKALRDACVELRLEAEWKSIASILADGYLRAGQYGLSATMSLQAEDAFMLSRVAEKILQEYIANGEAAFLRHVDELPPSLLNDAPLAFHQMLSTQSGSMFEMHSTAVSVFASRLTFLSELRDYLLYQEQGAKDLASGRLVNLLTSGVAPVGFWAVLLSESVPFLEGKLRIGDAHPDPDILYTSNDTFELLRVLQDVLSSATYAPQRYLGQLDLVLKRNQEPVFTAPSRHLDDVMKFDTTLTMKRMEEVRLACARNLARSLVLDHDNPF